MTRHPLLLLGLTAALMGTTAATGALAQEGQQAAAAKVETCDDLRLTLEQHADRIKSEMRADAAQMVREANDQKCADFFTEASVDSELTGQPAAAQDQTAQNAGQPAIEQQPPADQQDQTAQAAGQNAPQPGEQAQPGQADRTAEGGANIVVTQPEPKIQVQQQAPQVAVRQQQPQVTINQGEPQIEVHQAQPTIHVQMAQPVITIDQPQPQIIVRMPDPQVAVNAPQPQVEVRQAQPTVTVEQAKPQVQVLSGEQGSGEVAVNQEQPEVVQQMAEGQPQLEVQRAQPKVQYFPAEPKVQVEASGEPQVKVNQTGQPDIRIEQLQGTRETSATPQAGAGQQPAQPVNAEQSASASSQPGQQPAADQQASDQQQVASAAQQPAQQSGAAAGSPQENSQQVANANPQGEQAGAQANDQRLALIQLPQGQQPPAAGEARAYAASDLIGQPVTNWDGKALGTVADVVADDSGQFVVLAPDTPLGDGKSGVILPVETLAFTGGKLVMLGMDEQQVAALTSHDTSGLKSIGQDQQVNISTR